jgi:multiple sugar transport system ATP-binding protein
VSFLSIDQLRKVYPDGTEAVRGIDVSIDEGEFVVLLGPSGCGKTTTLRMIAGLELATAGRVTLAGKDVTTLRPADRDVGFVFQFYALYPHLSVRENIAFPLRSVGAPRREVAGRVDAVAQRLGLTNLLHLHPRQLSGGDQQRVSLARAMVRRPRAWLMDEPLGTLDADRRLAMRDFLREQQLESKVTTVYVTHDQEEAMSLADRIVVMNTGRILQVGTPQEVYDAPADLFVANFVGSPGMNFIKGRIDDGQFVPDAGGAIPAGRQLRPGPAVLGVRCEHVRAGNDGAIAGTVAVDEYLGTHRSVYFDTPVGRIIAREPAGARSAVGQVVALSFDPDRMNFFDAGDGVRLTTGPEEKVMSS